VDTLPADQAGALDAGNASVLREAVRALEIERCELEARLEKADRLIADLTREKDEGAVAIEKTTGRLSDLTARAETAAIESGRQLQRAEAQLGSARREIDRLAERNARVKASLSWRLTAPLRFLRRNLIDPFGRRH